jgi:hypothetical protein
MPLKDANTIKLLIFYQYAKNIARSVSGAKMKKAISKGWRRILTREGTNV